MALEELLATLEHNARAEADRVLADAKQEAAEIVARTAAEARRVRAAFLDLRGREYRATADAALAAARRETRATVLQARARFIERVLDAARAELPAIVTWARYHAILPDHVEEALRYAEDGEVVVRCHPVLADIVRAAVSGRDRISVEPDAAVGTGVTVVTRDGALRVPNTLEARLERLEPVLAIEILQRLGEQSCQGIGAT